jgi:hypothetical protein
MKDRVAFVHVMLNKKTLPLRRRARVVVTLTRCYPKLACYHWHLYRQANNTRDDRSSIISTPPLYNTKGYTVLVPKEHTLKLTPHAHSFLSYDLRPLLLHLTFWSCTNKLLFYPSSTHLIQTTKPHQSISYNPGIFQDHTYFFYQSKLQKWQRICSSLALQKYT